MTGAEASVVRGMVESELARTGGFKVAERSGTDMVLAENRLQYAGLTPEGAAAELARVSGAQYAACGSVTRDGDGYVITVRVVEASGSAAAEAQARAAEDYMFREASRRAAAALAAR